MNIKFLFLAVLHLAMSFEHGHTFKKRSQINERNDKWENSNQNLLINEDSRNVPITGEQNLYKDQNSYPFTWQEDESSIEQTEEENQNSKEENGEENENFKVVGDNYSLRQKFLGRPPSWRPRLNGTHQTKLGNKKITTTMRSRAPVKMSRYLEHSKYGERYLKQHSLKTRHAADPEYDDYLYKSTALLSSANPEDAHDNYQYNDNREATSYHKIQGPSNKRRGVMDNSRKPNSILETNDDNESQYNDYDSKQPKLTDFDSYRNKNNSFIYNPEKSVSDEGEGNGDYNSIGEEEPQISKEYQTDNDDYDNLSEANNDSREYEANNNYIRDKEIKRRNNKMIKKHSHKVNDTEFKDEELNSLFGRPIRLVSQQDKLDDSSSEDSGNFYFGETPKLKGKNGNDDKKNTQQNQETKA